MAGILAPPPFPTKLIVLAAGFLQMSRLRFCMAVAQILKEHCAAIFLVLAGLIAPLAFIGR